MKILETAFKIMQLLEMAHEMLQTLPANEHSASATAGIEMAHRIVQNKLTPPPVDAQ